VRLLRRPRLHLSWQKRLYARLIALVLLVAYAVAFILENGKTVNVHFVFATASVSLVWLILLALAVGLLAGILLVQLERRRSRRAHEPAEPGDPV
jgi:uncharacterized integral membrane protein